MEVSDVLFVPPSVIILTIHNYSYEVRKDQRNALVYIQSVVIALVRWCTKIMLLVKMVFTYADSQFPLFPRRQFRKLRLNKQVETILTTEFHFDQQQKFNIQ